MKFRTRLTWYGAMVAAVTVLTFGILLSALVRRTAPEDQDRDLADLAARTVTALATAPPATFSGPALPPVPVDIAAGTEQFIEVVAEDGRPVFSTGQVAGAPPVVPQQLIDQTRAGGATLATITPIPGVEIRVALEPFSRPDLDLTGVVVAGQSTGLTLESLSGLRAVLFIAGIITVLAAWLVSRLVAGRALEPLRRLATTTAEIATTGDFNRRLEPVASDDEVGALTVSFNAMLDRLAESHHRLADSLERQQRFVADASHELRNPLATIRSNLSFLEMRPEADPDDRRSALEDSAWAATRMTSLIDDLLRLARLDAGQVSNREPVSVVRAISEAVERSGLGDQVSVTVGSEPTVVGNEEDLTRIFTNLLDNAQVHGQPPFEVQVGAIEKGRVAITVGDSGPGIPPDQLERIFDRFYRGDHARSGGGTGLGLAISRALAVQHGGTLTAHNHDGGTVFLLTLPTA
ncbi:MAG: ATP-binding protein [Acidimicrobiia bacterium]